MTSDALALFCCDLASMETEQRAKWLYGQFHQSTESQSNHMDQYKEFCRLRDYRKPGAEVTRHTEAEAFALATAASKTPEFAALAEFVNDDAYAITCQSIGQYRTMLKKFIATQIAPYPVCHYCRGEKKLCSMNCGLASGDKRRMADVRRECDECATCHVCTGVIFPMSVPT